MRYKFKLADNPVETLGGLGREKLKGKSIKKLKQGARREIEKGVYKKFGFKAIDLK